MIVTAHWSASPPERLKDYHIEFGCPAVPAALNEICKRANTPTQVPWEQLTELFKIYKNFDFSTKTSYGTWHINSDPRDGSPNIEVAALCLGGTDVSVTGNWGTWPYTYAHFWMHCAIIARIAFIKDLDCNASFGTSIEPDVLQNAPIYVVSSHGERALQTNDEGEDSVPGLGYFIFSGDPDSRCDIYCKDSSEVVDNVDAAVKSCKDTAATLRQRAHMIKSTLTSESDMWGLDKDITP